MKYLIVAFLLIINVDLTSQIQNNTNVLGGSFSLNTRSERFSFEIEPYYGKVLTEKWLAGIKVKYGSNIYSPKGSLSQTQGFSDNTYGVGVFGRYLYNPENKLGFIISPSFDYTYNVTKQRFVAISSSGIQNNVKETQKSDLLSFGAAVGFIYELSEKLNVVLTVGNIRYNISKNISDYTGETTKNNYLNSSFNRGSIQFGFERKF